MANIRDNIVQVLQRVHAAALLSERDPNEITLVAVSKWQSVRSIETAYREGLTRFGENYLQEALDKMEQLSHLPIEWHFIGPVQSNKTAKLAENFDWIHTVAREKVARRLNDQRPDHLSPLQICLQINIDDDPNKAGVAPQDAEQLALYAAELPRLRLRGLMCIPAKSANAETRIAFNALARLQKRLRESSPKLANLDTLSMGMSDDLETAIGSGSTMLRIGTNIFGQRRGNHPKSGNCSAQE